MKNLVQNANQSSSKQQKKPVQMQGKAGGNANQQMMTVQQQLNNSQQVHLSGGPNQHRKSQKQSMSGHNRGRSSGVVMQQHAQSAFGMHPNPQFQSKPSGPGANPAQSANASEIQQLLQIQQQLAQQIPQNYNYQSVGGTSGGIAPSNMTDTHGTIQQQIQQMQQQTANQVSNPFRRQKQQAKYQQKYQQQHMSMQGAGSGTQIAGGRQQSRGSATGVNMSSSLAPYAPPGQKGKHQKHQTQLIGGQGGVLGTGISMQNAQQTGSRDLVQANHTGNISFEKNHQNRGSQGRPQGSQNVQRMYDMNQLMNQKAQLSQSQGHQVNSGSNQYAQQQQFMSQVPDSQKQSQQMASQQVHQQFINYTNHVRSFSNCSNQFGNAMGQQQFMSLDHGSLAGFNSHMAQQQQIQPRGPQVMGDHRKAPSSINILNHSNNLMGNFQANIPNIANVANLGQTAMTHQNLLIQPQMSQNLMVNQKQHSSLSEPPEEERVTEQQVLESEEYFESGKLFLQEKKYKDACKMFTKSLQANKTNYDALFYRAVTNLDQELPKKAIVDLEELMRICSDYRKTMFIVLSIAYRRVNDYLSAIRTLSKAIQRFPMYLEAYIARGQIYIFQKKWDKALNDFNMVLRYSPNNGMGYLGHGDSLKGLGRIEDAIKSYTRVIEVEPQSSSQGLMKRGLLLLELKKNEEALSDFNKLIEMAEDKNADFQSVSLSKAYFYKAKALKKINNLNDSVLYFEQVLRLAEDNFLSGSALYEIAKIKIQQKDFYEAHYNLQRSTHLNLKQKKLANYKLFTEGVIFLMKRKTKTGVKLLTQVIERMNPQALNASPSQVKKQSGGDLPDQNKGKNENENSASPGKGSQMAVSQKSGKGKNEKERAGSQIGKNQKEKAQAIALANYDEKDYIYPLLFIYRAYGHIVLEEYDKGLKDYLKSSQIKKLNSSQNFNMILCQGLKNFEQNEFENAISFFTKAFQCQPNKRDPFLLRAMAIVQYSIHKPIKPNTKIQMLKDAKKDLNRALEQSPKDESVLYLRGILNFALHRFYDAICDFERVIEKTDETNAIHYLARGRCYACLSMFKEAITDLSIAINLNKDLIDAYLNRGKCAYLIGDTGLAFMDFQKLIVLEPKNSSVHIYAGNLLMTTGSYEDATKAFTNADNIQKSPLALYQRSRCHVALNNMSDALSDLNKVIEISKNDKVAIQDRECLNSLMTCSVKDPKDTQKQNDAQLFLKSAQTITKLISYEKNENLARIVHESSIQHQHSQIIPSAHRTKIDKIRAIRRRKEQDRVQRENPEGGRKNDLRFRVQQQGADDDDQDEYEDISELDDREIERLNNKIGRSDSNELDQDSSGDEEDGQENGDQEANYYKENIFNKEDFYLYRSILYIYGGQFEKALSDLEQCSSIMHQNKVLYPKNQFPDEELGDDEDGYESPTGTGNVNAQNDHDENASNGSSQTDLSDVGLCSLNIHEFSYNTVLCLILSRNYEHALAKLDYILQTISKKYAGQLWLIRGIINQLLGYDQQATKDFKRAFKHDRENAHKYLVKGENIFLNVFPQQQRLCSFFQYIPVHFDGFKVPQVYRKGRQVQEGQKALIFLKPSFSFPFIKPPNMIPCVDQNLVLSQFQLKKSNVQLKPEAPWIKKCQFGIKFTEEILYTDDEREPTPDEEKEYKKRKQRQQERALEGAGFIRAHSEKVELRRNIFAEDNEDEAANAGQLIGADGIPINLLDGEVDEDENVLAHLGNVKEILEQEMKMKIEDEENKIDIKEIKQWEQKFRAWMDDPSSGKPGPHPDPNHKWNTQAEEFEYDDEDDAY